jgi:hypothetical protein
LARFSEPLNFRLFQQYPPEAVGLQSQVEGAEYNLLADHCVFALQHKYDLVGQFFSPVT